MRISRVVIRNFRTFEDLDVDISEQVTCVIGENNTGKSNFLHAIRVCIDASLSSTYRSLQPSDVHSAVDISKPSQVLIGLEIVGFAGKENEEALVGAWQVEEDRARLMYRFRPREAVREDLDAEELKPGDLKLSDYHWEMVGGGDPAHDLADIEWDDEVGDSIRMGHMQSFLVVFLPALRDVESDLRQYRGSPLARLVDALDIPPAEQDELVEILKKANKGIRKADSVEDIADAIDDSFKKVAGPAFSMDVGVGLAEPTFAAIVRSLRVLLTNNAMKEFDPSANGLGLNNVLYVAILIEYFNRRLAQGKTAGQLILFEEPEAHLHPQLQVSLFTALRALPYQSVMTTHSTHITGDADLASYVVLTKTKDDGVDPSTPATDAGLDKREIRDLERYLDATKSSLLFARKVMLVEGPAELFLIPALFKQIKGIDLEREGISVIPIYGVHFDVYAKLFGEGALTKRCAIVTDGDLQPSDADTTEGGEDKLPDPIDLEALENDYVKVFSCKTTFERAVTMDGNLEMFARAADTIGAPRVAIKLRKGQKELDALNGDDEARKAILMPLRKSVLSTAKRFGKARFAQLASGEAKKATSLPAYLEEAVAWLKEA